MNFSFSLDEKIVAHIATYAKNEHYEVNELVGIILNEFIKAEDIDTPFEPLMDNIAVAIKEVDFISISYLQRKFEISYYFAKRIIKELSTRGIIEHREDNKPRKVKYYLLP